ncbi:MAG TPA: tol-pal system protein YbgF, partial [Polyangia bacterium]
AASSIMADSANSAGDDQDPGGSKPASRPSEEIERTTKAETKRESARGRADHGKTHRAAEPAKAPANKALAKAAAKPEPAPPAPVVEETPPPAPVKLHPMTAPAKAKPVASGPKGSGTDLYNSALADLREGRHADAVAGLRTFVRLHAQHDLADNAQYWLGECYYDRKDYAAAAREFGKVGNEFPTGNKVPDAQLKLGLSQLALGNVRAARTALSDVVRRYPQHPAASLAGAKLAAIGGADASAALSRRPDSKEVR